MPCFLNIPVSLPRYNTDSSEKELWPAFTEVSWPTARRTDPTSTMQVKTIKRNPWRPIQSSDGNAACTLSVWQGIDLKTVSNRLPLYFCDRLFGLQRAIDLLRGNWQIRNLDADGVIHRVSDGCSSRNGTMFTDGLGLKGTRPIVISDIMYLMSRDVSDIWKFVLPKIVSDYFSIFVREIFHQGEAKALNH